MKRLEKLPEKKIAGVKHYQRMCSQCDLPVWTQSKLPGYTCNTCVRSWINVFHLKLTPAPKPLHSEAIYNDG